ncbi:N-acetyltransferase family protein [Patulibacter sp. S7RM1-6]
MSVDAPITLRDGSRAVLRPVRPDDEPRLLELLQHVTGDSRWLRFFTAGPNLDAAARYDAHAGDHGGFGILALRPDSEEVLGHGTCLPLGAGASEIAFEVADGYHRLGIGTHLLRQLVDEARRRGTTRLVAEVQPSNRDMIDMLTTSGLVLERSTVDGVAHFVLPIDPNAHVDGPSSAPLPG